MPKSSVAAAPAPRSYGLSTEPTSALEKAVRVSGLCMRVVLTATNDPWHPVQESGDVAARLARRACEGCPVTVSCLELALREESRTGSVHGVRGGVAPFERSAMLRAMRQVKSC